MRDKQGQNPRRYALRVVRFRFSGLLGLPSRSARARLIPLSTVPRRTVLGMSGQIASRSGSFSAFHFAATLLGLCQVSPRVSYCFKEPLVARGNAPAGRRRGLGGVSRGCRRRRYAGFLVTNQGFQPLRRNSMKRFRVVSCPGHSAWEAFCRLSATLRISVRPSMLNQSFRENRATRRGPRGLVRWPSPGDGGSYPPTRNVVLMRMWISAALPRGKGGRAAFTILGTSGNSKGVKRK